MAEEPTLLTPGTEPVTLTPAVSAAAPEDSVPPWKVRDGLMLLGGFLALPVCMRWVFERIGSPGPAVAIGAQILFEVLFIAAAVWIVRARAGTTRSWLLGRSSWFVEAALGFAFSGPLFCLGVGAGLAARFALGQPETGQRVAMFTGQLPLIARLIMAAMGVLLAPLAEEMLFRGLLLSSLRNRIGWFAAWLIQAVVFAVGHRDSPQATVVLFAVGLGLGAVYLWRRSVLASTVMHAGFNSLPMAWLVALVWINQHVPASTWEEAEQPPSWWSSPWNEQMAQGIPNQSTAEKQWDMARNYGSRGAQLWKLEARAFQKVIDRFPNDAEFAAKSLAGIQEIYLVHLHDPRRAIVTGRKLLARYPDERDACATATLANARAHVELGDPGAAAALAQEAAERFADLPHVQEQVQAIRDELARRRIP